MEGDVKVDVLRTLRNYYDANYANEERGPILQARIDALDDTSYWEMVKEWCKMEDTYPKRFDFESSHGKALYDALVTLRDEQLKADREEADHYNDIQRSKYD